MTTRKPQPGPGQGSFIDSVAPEVTPELTYSLMDLGHGITEGDSVDITGYLELYVDALRAIGRARSNSKIGFGQLNPNRKIVREFAARQNDPDRKAVQKVVVDSRENTHMKKAAHFLVKRAEFREKHSRAALDKGIFTQTEVIGMPLLEDPYMLEAEWFGDKNHPGEAEKTERREALYYLHQKYEKHARRTTARSKSSKAA